VRRTDGFKQAPPSAVSSNREFQLSGSCVADLKGLRRWRATLLMGNSSGRGGYRSWRQRRDGQRDGTVISRAGLANSTMVILRVDAGRNDRHLR